MSTELTEKRVAALYRQPSAPKVSPGFGQYPPIIALSGKRGAGKDTAADMVESLTKGHTQWDRLRFSGILKNFVADWLDVEPRELDKQEVKAQRIDSLGMTVGELLQRVGGGIRDLVHEDFWVIGAMNKVKPGRNYLCVDCRYPNELAAIEQAGGVVVRIAGDPLGQRGDGTRNDDHPSETALDEVELPTIRNRGNLHSLRAKVSNLLQHLGNGVRPTVEFAKHWLAFK